MRRHRLRRTGFARELTVEWSLDGLENVCSYTRLYFTIRAACDRAGGTRVRRFVPRVFAIVKFNRFSRKFAGTKRGRPAHKSAKRRDNVVLRARDRLRRRADGRRRLRQSIRYYALSLD